MRILVVEDDPLLARGLDEALRRWRHAPICVPHALAAQEALAAGRFDGVLLDLGLPDGDGLAVLRGLRGAGDATPVIVITARDAISARIAGLDAGADDYLVKPFHLDELAARLRALHRRARGLTDTVVSAGALVLDTVSGEASYAGRRIELSRSEFMLLRALAERAGRVVARERLERALYGNDGIDSNALEVHVHGLRRKLAPAAIRTVRGLGYLLSKDAPLKAGAR